SARIATMIGMTTKKISGPLSTLFADGLIEFEGKHGQRLYRLTSYGMKYAPETIPAMPKGNSMLVQRTETNVICQECRNSPAMRRVLMVWGRVGV
ncbi:TPA: transcriptional regulator, partial [Enterobacter hormaechei]